MVTSTLKNTPSRCYDRAFNMDYEGNLLGGYCSSGKG